MPTVFAVQCFTRPSPATRSFSSLFDRDPLAALRSPPRASLAPHIKQQQAGLQWWAAVRTVREKGQGLRLRQAPHERPPGPLRRRWPLDQGPQPGQG